MLGVIGEAMVDLLLVASHICRQILAVGASSTVKRRHLPTQAENTAGDAMLILFSAWVRND